MTLKKDIQNFNDAWNNFIRELAKAIYACKIVNWLSDKLKNKPKSSKDSSTGK